VTGFERYLTDEALADRLVRIANEPTRWNKREAEAYMREAARRLRERATQEGRQQ
jgi:hypothetical protein